MQAYVDALARAVPEWRELNQTSRVGVRGPVFSTLAKEGPDVEPPQQNPNCLHEQAAQGAVREVQSLLDGARATVDDRDEEGRTALHWAADRGQLPMVLALLRWGASVDLQDSDGQTALHYAALCEHEEIAKTLMESGAVSTIRDNMNETPRDYAPKLWTLWD
eukprot:evm.model.scf_3997.1 EVM.evm.TU.scf_3997.1   scf_3997:5735-7146(+)